MIKYSVDVIAVFLLFGIFGYMHSYLASYRVKNFLIKKFGSLIAFYRLSYVLFSLISFGVIYKIAPHPELIVYDLPYPFDFIILIPEFLGLAGLLWTLKYFSSKEFLGINQIFRWYHHQYRIDELDEKLTLRIEGPYKYCRHPVYFFSIVFLVFRPEMNLFYASFLACIIAYFYIGSFYEEIKMVAMFGQIYIDYQNQVPRIVPIYLYWNKIFNIVKNVKSKQIF
ncbi:MAG: methyltransferase family protein [Ignavibacteriaceae bacterium]